MKILYCCSEAVPFAKEGGLADVAGSLPLELEKLGQDISICVPFYKSVKKAAYKFSVVSDDILYTNITDKTKVYFIRNDKYFNRDGIYGDASGDYPDNIERFSFFCRKVLELVDKVNLKPDIIHCNDWQAALIPVYIKAKYNSLAFRNIKTLLTIHNLGYQGIFPKEQFLKLGLDNSLFSVEGLEFYGKVNLLKGGIVFADILSTVSESYAGEIQAKDAGFGLEGLLQKRKNDLYGILNGIDYKIWNPKTDKLIFKNYSAETIGDKYVNKKELRNRCSFNNKNDTVLFGFIGRLAQQKGLDLFAKAADKMAALDAQFILLGCGQQYYHNLLDNIAQKYPKKFSVNIKFDEALAHMIYASSDVFLMPSCYEPCGLGQMIAFKYGSIPLVYATGGLADTVNANNGFVFSEYTADAFLNVVTEAISAYKNKDKWNKMVKHGLGLDFSWKQSAKCYVELYKKTINN